MDESQLDGISSLVRLTGVNIPSRARFVGEALVQSTLTSMTLGLSFGMVGGALVSIGPLVPFCVGSWMGYTCGLWHHWSRSKESALLFARRYPTILAHSLATERAIFVPPPVVQASEDQLLLLSQKNHTINNDNDKTSIRGVITLEEWIRQGGLGRLTWSILAAQSCRGDVEELQKQQRQRLMEEHQEKYG